MIRRHVLAALATGVEAGDDDAARAAVAQTEWVLRGSARRQLERSLIDAALLSGELVSAADPDAMRHIQRVAALTLAGRYDVNATDRDGVNGAYRDLLISARVPVATTTPIATMLAGLSVLVFAGLIAWLVVSLRAHHHRPRREVPMVAGAYLLGGTPLRDAELEQLLVTELPSFAVETDQVRQGGGDDHARRDHVAALRSSPIIAVRGLGLAGAWRAMIDAFDHWTGVASKGRSYRDAEERLRSTTQAVSDQLAALGLGYHLEADVLADHRAAHGGIFVFRVEDVVYVHADGEPRRVLSLRRLDHLNITHNLLGMQTEQLGDPVVLLDQVEEFVAHRVAPVVGSGHFSDGDVFGAPFALGDASWFRTNTGFALSNAASEAIRRELAPVDAKGGIEAMQHAVVATVRRHEARHGLDIDRELDDRPLRYPALLAVHLGADVGTQRKFILRARAELSAYTSQIASDPVTPQLALWNLANLGFNRDHRGSAESYVAVVVIEGLARHLGIAPADGPVIHDGQLDRDRLAHLAMPLAAQTDDALRAAAREVWQDLYAEPFMAIVD